MPTISPIRPVRQPGSPVGGTLLGAGLVAAGLGLAFLTVETPLAARLVTGGLAGSGQLPYAAFLWVLGLVAGAAMLVAGTERMAVIVASLRSARTGGSPVALALAALPPDAVVVRGVVPQDGRPVRTVVIGQFGAAVVGELDPPDRLRRVDGSWQARTRDGWAPTEHPLDQTARDAERVRHWLNHGELDFVVRVYAALVTSDVTIPRSPLCAVITAEQIPDWIEALPRQRSLNDGRRNVLVARARSAVALSGRRQGA